MSAVTVFVVYRLATGAILRGGTCVEPDLPLQAADASEVVLVVPAAVDQAASYVDITVTPPAIAARTALAAPSDTTPAVDQVVTWAAVPGGTFIVVSGPASDVWTHDAGDVEIAFGAPGTYTVRFIAQVPFADREDLIHVSA